MSVDDKALVMLPQVLKRLSCEVGGTDGLWLDDAADTIAELTALRKVAELTNNAVEAGAIDEIYLSLIRDALAGWRRSK